MNHNYEKIARHLFGACFLDFINRSSNDNRERASTVGFSLTEPSLFYDLVKSPKTSDPTPWKNEIDVSFQLFDRKKNKEKVKTGWGGEKNFKISDVGKVNDEVVLVLIILPDWKILSLSIAAFQFHL